VAEDTEEEKEESITDEENVAEETEVDEDTEEEKEEDITK